MRVLGRIGRRERAAVLARQIEVDGEQLVQHEAVVLDRRHMAVRIDLEEIGRPGVETLSASSGREAIALHHRHEPERDAELVREPDVARGARAVDAVDGEHAGPPSCHGDLARREADGEARQASQAQPGLSEAKDGVSLRATIRGLRCLQPALTSEFGAGVRFVHWPCLNRRKSARFRMIGWWRVANADRTTKKLVACLERGRASEAFARSKTTGVAGRTNREAGRG